MTHHQVTLPEETWCETFVLLRLCEKSLQLIMQFIWIWGAASLNVHRFCFPTSTIESITNESLFAMATVWSFGVLAKSIRATEVGLSFFTFVDVCQEIDRSKLTADPRLKITQMDFLQVLNDTKASTQRQSLEMRKTVLVPSVGKLSVKLIAAVRKQL